MATTSDLRPRRHGHVSCSRNQTKPLAPSLASHATPPSARQCTPAWLSARLCTQSTTSRQTMLRLISTAKAIMTDLDIHIVSRAIAHIRTHTLQPAAPTTAICYFNLILNASYNSYVFEKYDGDNDVQGIWATTNTDYPIRIRQHMFRVN